MAAGESPKVAISSPAQYCGLRLRRAPGSESCVRRWCEEYRGQRLAGLAHKIFLKLLKAKRSARRGGEAEDPAQDGKRALCGRHLRAGPRGAGEAGLCGQRADFAGALRRLPQREDAERERAAHEFGEPRGVRPYGVRPEPQAAPGF